MLLVSLDETGVSTRPPVAATAQVPLITLTTPRAKPRLRDSQSSVRDTKKKNPTKASEWNPASRNLVLVFFLLFPPFVDANNILRR